MADSIPKLQRLLNEAHERIRELESVEPEVIERVVQRIVEVPGPERVIEKLVPFSEPVAWYPPSVERVEVVRVEYVDNPDQEATIAALQARVRELTAALFPPEEVVEE